MAWKEKLYERRLRRPVDHRTLEAIRSEFERRRHEIPVAAELVGLADHGMTIKTKWLSLIVHFTKDTLKVEAELSLAARMLATDANRKFAVQFIDSIAEDLNL